LQVNNLHDTLGARCGDRRGSALSKLRLPQAVERNAGDLPRRIRSPKIIAVPVVATKWTLRHGDLGDLGTGQSPHVDTADKRKRGLGDTGAFWGLLNATNEKDLAELCKVGEDLYLHKVVTIGRVALS
jgi:hypothetical protein